MNFKRRVGRLEKEMHVATEIERCRITVWMLRGEVDRAKSTCRRTLSSGQLYELSFLYGGQEATTDDELAIYRELSDSGR